ncbi:hypothetical protein PILCRDRAFT_819788 [Piloderma croceum F 1598]|uniref:Uncharacterized protein n=1 Tax=Piloderma croceum (strain F 1598) TaxID=765440 RepID=A0A0C3C058_PILCF|nr:hypothetical protein PILCRDRAFT_819788 [Piloderma croceum F 1598]
MAVSFITILTKQPLLILNQHPISNASSSLASRTTTFGNSPLSTWSYIFRGHADLCQNPNGQDDYVRSNHLIQLTT